MIKAAVLGSPISHSLSPLLHNTAYAQLGIQGSYEAIEVNAGGLAKFIDERQQEQHLCQPVNVCEFVQLPMPN